MTNPLSLEERCKLAVDCLPAAPYKEQLETLLADLLAHVEDARRFRKLQAVAKETLLRPNLGDGYGLPDLRTHWVLPTLMCSGPVGGFVPFAEAVDDLPAPAPKKSAT